MWNKYIFGDHSARFLIHYVPYDALLMESVECITGFKSSDGYILLGGKIMSLANGASNKRFHAPN